MGKSIYISLVGLLPTFGCHLFGFDIATSSGTIPVLQSHYQLSDAQVGSGKAISAATWPLFAAHFVFFSNERMLPTLMFAKGQTVKGQNCKISSTANGIIAEGAQKNIFSLSAGGKKIVMIPRSMALQANRIGDRFYFSDADLLINGKTIDVISRGNNSPIVSFYPASTAGLNIQGAEVVEVAPPSKLVSSFTVKFKPVTLTLQFEKISTRKYALKSGASLNGLNDIILRITYKGDRSMAFFDGPFDRGSFLFWKTMGYGAEEVHP